MIKNTIAQITHNLDELCFSCEKIGIPGLEIESRFLEAQRNYYMTHTRFQPEYKNTKRVLHQSYRYAFRQAVRYSAELFEYNKREGFEL